MDTDDSLASPNFRLVSRKLVDLHRLIRSGKDESFEAESLRDDLDNLLPKLSRAEYERARWLSEDLYSISEPEAASTWKTSNPQVLRKLVEVDEACSRFDWDCALDLVRRWQKHVPQGAASFKRGTIWYRARDFDVAAEFLGHALDLDPRNDDLFRQYSSLLSDSDSKAAAMYSNAILAEPKRHNPTQVLKAAHIAIDSARDGLIAEGDEFFLRLRSILLDNLERLHSNEIDANLSPVYAMTATLIGFLAEFLGKDDEAVGFFTLGLNFDPKNDGLLVARGILLYGSSYQAIDDLQKAVDLNSPLVWPYLLLAHHFVRDRQFKSCLRFCDIGLQKPGPLFAKSQLNEWRAIAQAELGEPAEVIESLFKLAISQDPTNSSAKRNLAIFDDLMKTVHLNLSVSWLNKPIDAVRQTGKHYFRSLQLS